MAKGWRREPMRHALARKGVKTGRTPRTTKLPEEVRLFRKRLALGTSIEQAEHPSFSHEQVEEIARDHLREKPDYYDKHMVKKEKKKKAKKKRETTSMSGTSADGAMDSLLNEGTGEKNVEVGEGMFDVGDETVWGE
jgi:hypothetical protein